MLQDLSSPFIDSVQQCKVLLSSLFLWTNHCPGSSGIQNIYILWFLSVGKFQGKSTHFWWVGKGIQEKGRGDTGVPKDKFACIPASLWAIHVRAWQPGEVSWGGKGAKGGNTSLCASFLQRLYEQPAKLLARSKAAANTGKKCSGASQSVPAVDCSQSFILGWVVRAAEGPAGRASHTQRGQFSCLPCWHWPQCPFSQECVRGWGRQKWNSCKQSPSQIQRSFAAQIFSSQKFSSTVMWRHHVHMHPCAHAPMCPCPHTHTHNTTTTHGKYHFTHLSRCTLSAGACVRTPGKSLCTWRLPLLWWGWMLVRKDPRYSTWSSSSFSELCDSKFSANCKENFSKIPKLKWIYEALYCMWYTKTLLVGTEHAHACKCTHTHTPVHSLVLVFPS